jgi:hypothetical protein
LFEFLSAFPAAVGKNAVKGGIIDLGRGAHLARSRATHSGTGAGFPFGLRLPNGTFKFGGKFHLVFNKIVKPIADLPQFRRGQLPQFTLKLLHFVHGIIMHPLPENIKLSMESVPIESHALQPEFSR